MLLAKAPESTYEPAPEGLHQAVCVDVVDLGLVTSEYGTKHKVELRFQLDCQNAKGARHQVRKRYTLSLHERAGLRKDLQTWRGRKFTDDELKGFDLEKLISVNGQIQIVHNLSDDGRTWANLQAIVPLGKGAPRMAAENYVRQQDRPTEGSNGHHGVMDGAAFQEPELDPVPFAWMLPFVLPVVGAASAAMAFARWA